MRLDVAWEAESGAGAVSWSEVGAGAAEEEEVLEVSLHELGGRVLSQQEFLFLMNRSTNTSSGLKCRENPCGDTRIALPHTSVNTSAQLLLNHCSNIFERTVFSKTFNLLLLQADVATGAACAVPRGGGAAGRGVRGVPGRGW